MTLSTSWPCAPTSTRADTRSGTTSKSAILRQGCRIASLLSTLPSVTAYINMVCGHCCTQKLMLRSTMLAGEGQGMKSSIIKTMWAKVDVGISHSLGRSSFLMTETPAILPTAILTPTPTCRSTWWTSLKIQWSPSSARFASCAVPWQET